jgi:hypothetical protein
MRVVICPLVVLVVLVASLPAFAWGPGAHAVVATEVAAAKGVTVSNEYLLLQGLYGSSAPDFAWFASEPLASALGTATHDDPGFCEPWDKARWWSPVQRAFAWGWLTHNEVWGADYYAHVGDPLAGTCPAPAPGYVVERAAALSIQMGIPEDIAHNYVEVAIDLLLDQEDPSLQLGQRLVSAAASRDWQVPVLLIRSYADVPGASRLTVRALEGAHRAYLGIYGQGLALPTGPDDAAFAAGMAALYGLTPANSAASLAAAKVLCQDAAAHYQDALSATIALVANAPLP